MRLKGLFLYIVGVLFHAEWSLDSSDVLLSYSIIPQHIT